MLLLLCFLHMACHMVRAKAVFAHFMVKEP